MTGQDAGTNQLQEESIELATCPINQREKGLHSLRNNKRNKKRKGRKEGKNSISIIIFLKKKKLAWKG